MNDTEIVDFVSPYSLCGNERILNAIQIVDKVAKENIPGDFVEAGVYKGGIIMAMALKCKQLGLDRNIYAYDTFSGMTQPTAADVNLHNIRALDLMNESMCSSSLEETRSNMEKTGYSNVTFCMGDIVSTNLETIPKQIALLRLDTDWYESTKFELDHFEPNVVQGGYVIIDDYGHWKGSRRAVDEFLEVHPQTLHEIDYTGRYWKKV
jgi:hypothetical protein